MILIVIFGKKREQIRVENRMFVDQFFLVGTMIVSVSAKFRQSDYQSNIFVNVHGKE